MEALLEAMQNFGQDGCNNGLTTCEAELQELMKQIDIMVAQKKSEWEAQFQSVETRLKVREQELSAFRLLLDQKHTEVGILRQQLQDNEKVQRDMVVQYETQLNIFREEIGKLKKSYEKLQRRQLKEKREDVKERSEKEGMSELNRLSKKVEEFREKSLEWEKQRFYYQQQVASLDAERKLLAEQCKTIQKSVEENEELKSKLQAQENIIRSKDLHQEQLYKELVRCNELLKAKEKTASRSLEDSLQEQPCSDISHRQAELQQVPMQIQQSLQEDVDLKEEFLLLQHSLDSSNDRCTFLSGEICKKDDELRQMEKEHSSCKMDIKKLRDQLNSLEHQRHSELKGMKLEIAQLTTELHQRDLTIATMSAATSNMERQLRIELDKTDKKVKEVKQNCSISDLRDGYFSSLRQLEQENQQLQKELADVRSKLETSAKVSQDRYEKLLLQIQSKLMDIRETEDRRVEELQLEHKKEIKELQNKLREVVAHSEEDKCGSQSQVRCSESNFHNLTEGRVTERTFSKTIQSDSSDASLSESLRGATSCVTLSADENEADFSDNLSAQSAHSLPSEQFLPLSPKIASTKTSIAVRYLEEEDRRSQKLLQRLDTHIEELKTESERTVDKYVYSTVMEKQLSGSR
ncbi:centrosomal protein of 63 kDa isoform X5 [Chiloscyllium plagiosum]|uniref:centrosomal protein of 63 kDa isoform X5 n=1 Tax=Chiloscyllium plagiosum TaxID=36176 RepID=UPI001CB87DDD|nr:centrosomal protein of 63 kDa isoform X5 [Chiloscyllium plagiosum]